MSTIRPPAGRERSNAKWKLAEGTSVDARIWAFPFRSSNCCSSSDFNWAPVSVRTTRVLPNGSSAKISPCPASVGAGHEVGPCAAGVDEREIGPTQVIRFRGGSCASAIRSATGDLPFSSAFAQAVTGGTTAQRLVSPPPHSARRAPPLSDPRLQRQSPGH